MHVRVTTTKRGSRSYRSVQLVQSYRRADGLPAHRVLASFGNLPPLVEENLKRAVAASRQGQAVVLASQRRAPTAVSKVKRNLAYLDVATCLRTWQDWQLSELLDELAPAGRREVSMGELVAALTVQRCVAPASKLEASRWYGTTALPELQGVGLAQFNNTRIHRVLDLLDAIETPLQQRLARRIETAQGCFVSLFLDCTDTWFVGRGPELARQRVTKEGLLRRRIGIALLCDQRGFPLRWATVAGNHHEAATMLNLIDAVSQLSWAEKLPLVVDRAMGNGATIESLLEREVRFVTAVPALEIAGYSSRIPLGAFDQVPLEQSDRHAERALERLRQAARDAGFQQQGERYLLDLGLIAKGEGGQEAKAGWASPSRAVAAMTAANTIRRELAAGTTQPALAARYQCTVRTLQSWSELSQLETPLQQRILDGDADRVTPRELKRIARLAPHQQAAAFNQACAAAARGPLLRASHKLAGLFHRPALHVRAVALFNPARFVEQRLAALGAVRALEAVVAAVNKALVSPNARMSREQAVGKVGHALRKDRLTDVFDVVVAEAVIDGRQVSQLRLQRNDRAWLRHRRTDGFTLMVSHPAVLESPEQLVTLYFAKDLVEKDFQAIKSVLALRPVNHQTDPKVRAHVSLCMLALLLERTLEQRLKAAGLEMTAVAALHALSTAHLNLYAGEAGIYSATEPDPDQRRILTALQLEDLANDELLSETLTPR